MIIGSISVFSINFEPEDPVYTEDTVLYSKKLTEELPEELSIHLFISSPIDLLYIAALTIDSLLYFEYHNYPGTEVRLAHFYNQGLPTSI